MLYQNRTLTFEVTGTGATALVVYSHNREDDSDQTEVTLPWTMKFTGDHSSFNLQAKALPDDTATCKVSLGRKVIAMDTQPSSRWAGCWARLSER